MLFTVDLFYWIRKYGLKSYSIMSAHVKTGETSTTEVCRGQGSDVNSFFLILSDRIPCSIKGNLEYKFLSK